MRTITVSSGSTTIHALISGTAGSVYQTAPAAGAVCACAPRGGNQKPRTNAPAPARTSRRFAIGVFMPRSYLHEIRGQVDRLTHAVIARAAAGVRHGCVDVGIGRLGVALEQ